MRARLDMAKFCLSLRIRTAFQFFKLQMLFYEFIYDMVHIYRAT